MRPFIAERIGKSAEESLRALEKPNTLAFEFPDYLHSAVGILHEYISETLTVQLEKHLGIERKKPLKDNGNNLDSSVEENKPKRRKTEVWTAIVCDDSVSGSNGWISSRTVVELVPIQASYNVGNSFFQLPTGTDGRLLQRCCQLLRRQESGIKTDPCSEETRAV